MIQGVPPPKSQLNKYSIIGPKLGVEVWGAYAGLTSKELLKPYLPVAFNTIQLLGDTIANQAEVLAIPAVKVMIFGSRGAHRNILLNNLRDYNRSLDQYVGKRLYVNQCI